jgi:SAM-dependent methyltransferase
VGARDRSIRFVFDTVVDSYASGRPDMPVEVVRRAAQAVGVPAGARVLEIGAGAGQLTHVLIELGYDVTSLEPGVSLRERAGAGAPGACFLGETFEEFEAGGRYDAIFSSNAFHWVDPDVGYAKAATLADPLILIWNSPFIADEGLRRRAQDEVINPHGSTFPTEEADIRRFVDDEIAEIVSALRESGRFGEPWTHVHERRLTYTPERYRHLVGSMGYIVAGGKRETIIAGLEPLLGEEPFELVDLVWAIAARCRP